jgi:hypothetical protein
MPSCSAKPSRSIAAPVLDNLPLGNPVYVRIDHDHILVGHRHSSIGAGIFSGPGRPDSHQVPFGKNQVDSDLPRIQCGAHAA